MTRTKIQQNLLEKIKTGSDEPVYFGKITKRKLKEINKIRKEKDIPLLKDRDLFVFPKVIKKFQEKRINLDKLSPDTLVDIAYSAIHNKKGKVLSTKYPHIQVLMKIGEKNSNLAFIGITVDKISSFKDTYLKKTKELRKTKK